jgi:hypothetical protein
MGKGFAVALQYVKRGTCPFSALVGDDEIRCACAKAAYRSQASVYTPITTILTFLNQLLKPDGCCQRAVNELIAERIAGDAPACSADTGGYCKARARIPEAVYRTLATRSGQLAEQQAEADWLWYGHRVRIADGSTLQLADTQANRNEYPLQRNLKPGLHYPVVRILVLFSLATCTVLDAALRPYQGKGTGELAMLREMAELFEPGDVLLADRYFSGYWDVAFWRARGVHVVVRNSASRRSDFRRGRRLGKDDHLIEWKKTPRPDWIDASAARNTPATLQLREVRIRVAVKGFRTREVIVITSLTDAQAYPRSAIADLYRQRWQAELNLRSLKTHLGMGHLHCKTPAMIRNEFMMYLLAYNAIRRVAAEAARDAKSPPSRISFQNTRQAINAFFPSLPRVRDVLHWLKHLLHVVASVSVGHRPNRIEPYSCKTRAQEFPPPKEPRARYKRRKQKSS